MRGEVHGHRVHTQASKTGGRIELNDQLLGVHGHPQVPIVIVIEVIKGKAEAGDGGILFEIRDVGALLWIMLVLVIVLDERQDRMAAAAADHEGHLVAGPFGKLNRAREPLVIMRVARQHGMGINADLLADGIDVTQHRRAALMLPTTAAAAGGGIAEGQMMHGQEYGPKVVFLLNPGQLSRQIGKL